MSIALRTNGEMDAIAAAGELLDRVLTEAVRLICLGAPPREADAVARAMIDAACARSMLDHERRDDGTPFPGVISVNVGPVVANGPPGDRAIDTGVPFTVDCAVSLDGWVADGSWPAARGVPPDKLGSAATQITRAMVDAIGPGVAWCEAVRAGREAAEAFGVAMVDMAIGHGVGRRMHERPHLFSDTEQRLIEGMVLAIEPAVAVGGGAVRLLEDGWSLATASGASAAFREVTVGVTGDGVRVLAAGGRRGEFDRRGGFPAGPGEA